MVKNLREFSNDIHSPTIGIAGEVVLKSHPLPNEETIHELALHEKRGQYIFILTIPG